VNDRPDADESISSSSLWHVWYRAYRLMHPMTSPLQQRSEDADRESLALYEALRDQNGRASRSRPLAAPTTRCLLDALELP